jgi:hypothetical protein
MTMNFPYSAKPADDRFTRLSGLAMIAVVLLAMCSALVV